MMMIKCSALKDALASGHSHKDAVVHVTAISGRAKKEVYRIALTLKDADSTTPSPLTRKGLKPQKFGRNAGEDGLRSGSRSVFLSAAIVFYITVIVAHMVRLT